MSETKQGEVVPAPDTQQSYKSSRLAGHHLLEAKSNLFVLHTENIAVPSIQVHRRQEENRKAH